MRTHKVNHKKGQRRQGEETRRGQTNKEGREQVNIVRPYDFRNEEIADGIAESGTKNGNNCKTWNLAEFAKLSIIWLKLIRNKIKSWPDYCSNLMIS